jgi:two-component system invasion response regulator UvrY
VYKILIADDHAVVRQGLKRILATASDMTVVGEAVSRLDVLTMLRQPVDALTLDLAMPGTDGMALLTEVKTLYRSLPIVVLSMYSDPPYVKRALKLGALGFIPKTAASTELVTAIRQVIRGKSYVSQTFDEDMFYTEEPSRPLSPREREVLDLIGQGMKLAEIAQHLQLSAKTVSTYQSHLVEKLHLKSAKELVRAAVKRPHLQ